MKVSMFLLLPVIALPLEFYVFVDVLNVRECPSLGCEVIGTYGYGRVFEVLDVVHGPGYDWVRSPDGFVALQYVDVVPVPPSSVTICFDPNTSTRPLPPDYVPPDLVEIPVGVALKKGLMLRSEALKALLKMVEAAREEGVELRVVSAYRSWYRQRELYTKAIEEYGPDQRWVAKPGRSEHQLGVAVDLVGSDVSLALKREFASTKEYEWLKRNARKFGFYQSYPEGNPFYEEEPWHFRYSPCIPYPSEGR